MSKDKKELRRHGPEGGINPDIAAQVRFNNHPSAFVVIDEYCLNPECDCRDVTLEFYEVEGIEFKKLYFKILVNVDTWEMKDHHIFIQDSGCEQMIEEFIRDVDKPTKSRIKKRFEAGKQYGGDQLRQDLDPTAYKHGDLVLYCDVFNSPLYHLFTFDYGCDNYYVLDRYCISPGCKCKEVHLEFHIKEKNDTAYRLMFGVMLSLKTGKYRIEGKYGNLSNKQIKEIYLHFMDKICSIKKENDLDFMLLKDRYNHMKKVNLLQHSAEAESSDRSRQSSKKAVTVKAGRNEPCPCGSGKKYKKCCGRS